MQVGKTGDRHWDLVIEIAAKLWVDGQYTAELEKTPTQRYIDLQWAARHAGRVLGGRAKVNTGPPRSRNDPTVTVTVTYQESPGEKGFQRAEDGLESLLRRVLEESSS